MMHDGSMSAEEYLRRAADLTSRQHEMAAEQRVLSAHKQRADAARVLDQQRLNTHLRQAMDSTSPAATVEVEYKSARFGEPVQWSRIERQRADGVDLMIRGVHNLPCSVLPSDPLFVGEHSATSAMRRQLSSDNYPTLEEHLARTSQAYEPVVDEIGHLVYKPLSKDEEDDLRTRTNRDPV